MSRKIKRNKKAGLIVISVGAGLILAVLVPFYGWILVVGAALIIGGWNLIQKSKN